MSGLVVAALGGCSLLRIGYGQLDVFAAWTADDYFDLDPDQRRDFVNRFEKLHDWHRYEQLPEYAAFLAATRGRVEKGLTREDVLRTVEYVQGRYRIAAGRAADDAAAMLLTVTTAQIENLQRQWDRRNHRFVRQYRLDGSLDEQREARQQQVLSRISDWTGSLSTEQEQAVAVMMRDWPLTYKLRHEDRLRRQREFLKLLEGRGNPREFAARLRHWLLHWEEGRDPAYDRLFKDWLRRQADLFVAVDKSLTSRQRAAVLRRLDNFIEDFRRLSERPPDRAAAGR
jgi:hypothetical protein